jgi:ribitol-5-phosphate 2-dehydrogenase
MINTIYRLKSPKIFEESFEEIEVSENEILIRPSHFSICKADQRYYRGERSFNILNKKLPMALIHEGIGEVVYSKSDKFSVGNIVVMIPNVLNGNNIDKSNKIISGNYLKSSEFMSSDVDGFLKEYLVLKDDRVLKIPNSLNSSSSSSSSIMAVSSFIELLSVAVHGISRFKNISHSKKESIGVWGDGNMGYIVSLILKHFFPNSEIHVFGKDSEKSSFFSFVDKFHVIHELDENIAIDHAFECVGGENSQLAISQIINHINPEGSLILMGVSEYPVNIATRTILAKGLTLSGISRSEYDDFRIAINILNSEPKIVSYLANLIYSVVDVKSIDDLIRAFEEDHQHNFGKTVLLWNK